MDEHTSPQVYTHTYQRVLYGNKYIIKLTDFQKHKIFLKALEKKQKFLTYILQIKSMSQ